MSHLVVEVSTPSVTFLSFLRPKAGPGFLSMAPSDTLSGWVHEPESHGTLWAQCSSWRLAWNQTHILPSLPQPQLPGYQTKRTPTPCCSSPNPLPAQQHACSLVKLRRG